MLNFTSVMGRLFENDNVMTFVNITEKLVNSADSRVSQFIQEFIMPFLEQLIKISRASSTLNPTDIIGEVFTSEDFVKTVVNITERLASSLDARSSKYTREFVKPYLGQIIKASRESPMLDSTKLVNQVFNKKSIVLTLVNITARMAKNVDSRSSKFIQQFIMPFLDELIKISRESPMLNSTTIVDQIFNKESFVLTFFNITARMAKNVDSRSSKFTQQFIMPFLDELIKISRKLPTLNSSSVIDQPFTSENFVRALVSLTERQLNNSAIINSKFIRELIIPVLNEIVKVSRESSLLNFSSVIDITFYSENIIKPFVQITGKLMNNVDLKSLKFIQGPMMKFLNELITVARESPTLNPTNVISQVFKGRDVIMTFFNVTERLIGNVDVKYSQFIREFVMRYMDELIKVSRQSSMLNSTNIIGQAFKSKDVIMTFVNITERLVGNVNVKYSQLIREFVMRSMDELIKVSREFPMLNATSVISRAFNYENILMTFTNITTKLVNRVNWKSLDLIEKIIAIFLDKVVQVSRESPFLNSTCIINRVFNNENVLRTFINVTGQLFDSKDPTDLKAIEEFIEKNVGPLLLQLKKFMFKANGDMTFNLSKIANVLRNKELMNFIRMLETLQIRNLTKRSSELIQRFLMHFNLSKIANVRPERKPMTFTQVATVLSKADLSKISGKLIWRIAASLNTGLMAFLDEQVDQSFTDPHQRKLIKKHYKKIHNILKIATEGMIDSEMEWITNKIKNLTADGIFDKQNFDQFQTIIDVMARVANSGSLTRLANNTVDFLFELFENFPDMERFVTTSFNSFFHNALKGIYAEYGILIDGEMLMSDMKRAFAAVYSGVSIKASATDIKSFFTTLFSYFSLDLSSCDPSGKQEYEFCVVDNVVSSTERFIKEQIINNLFNIRIYLNFALKWKRAFRKIDDLPLPLNLKDSRSLMKTFAKIVVRVQSELKSLFQNATFFEEFAKNIKTVMTQSIGKSANLVIRNIEKVVIKAFGPSLKSVVSRFIEELKKNFEERSSSNRYIITSKENLKAYATYLAELESFINNISAKLFSSSMNAVDLVLKEGQFERITSETTAQEKAKILIDSARRILSKSFPHGLDTLAGIFNDSLPETGINFKFSGLESVVNDSISKLYSSALKVMDIALKEGLFERLSRSRSAKENCKIIVTSARRILSDSISNGLEVFPETPNGPFSKNGINVRLSSGQNMLSLGLLNDSVTNSFVEQLKSSPGHIGQLYRSLTGELV